ncbi:Adenosine kinase 2 [Portunus trituberculatus]|uniref:Adenosine kinase n=1 Tax=Portunus trituberculatus TaxID=210409 RepID=A0A5B7EJG9_PORTR|nr:Adenosine kinase 2 [Portunus trituberculatus]
MLSTHMLVKETSPKVLARKREKEREIYLGLGNAAVWKMVNSCWKEATTEQLMARAHGSQVQGVMLSAVFEGSLFGVGNPLLDIAVNTDSEYLKKYELEANNAILAEKKHEPMYKEMADMEGVEYLAGGATQNSMRVAQWILRKKHCATFMGSVGKDDFSKTLEQKAEEAGVKVKYQKQDDHPTGTCAVVITKNGACRSLVANLAAANHFSKSHLDVPENKALMEKAKFYYISGLGFMLT